MGLWFWKPGETVNPQQPLSAQLYGQGDPGEGWSQSRSATPASLADSYGGSGVCSFDAPNRSGGMPDLLFGMDVQLYGSWSQVGKVTDVDTDGDYTSYNVDDVLARFNKQVKVGPLAVGYQSPEQEPPTGNDPRRGDEAWEATQTDAGIAVDDRGAVYQGMWKSNPGGGSQYYGSDNYTWDNSFYMEQTAVSKWGVKYAYQFGRDQVVLRFDAKSGTFMNWVDAGWENARWKSLGTYRNEYVFLSRWDIQGSGVTAVHGVRVMVYTADLTLVREFFFPETGLPYDPSKQNEEDDLSRDFISVAVDEYSSPGRLILGYKRIELPPVGSSNGGTNIMGVAYADFEGNRLGVQEWVMDTRWAGQNGVGETAYTVLASKNGPVGISRQLTQDSTPTPTGMYWVYIPSVSSRAVWSGFLTEHGADGQFAWHDGVDALVYATGNLGQYEYGASSYRLLLVKTPTLRQAYLMYMLEAGVPLDIAIDNSSVFDEEVSYPDWEGNLLDKLVELAAVTRTQFSPGILPGTVEVEEIGGTIHKQLPQATGGKPSLSLGTGQAVDSYTVVSQQARVVNPDSMELVYDARLEGNLIEFRPQDVIRETVSVPHSLTAVADVTRGLGYGQYAVADSEGVNVTQSFEDAGGYVTVSVNPDNPRAIDIEIFGGRTKLAGTGPYTLGYGQTESNQIIPRFSILGAGIFLDPREVTIYTGADPDFSGGAIGPTFQSEFIESKDVAYDVANMVNMRYATPEFSASLSWPSGTERSEPDVGDTVPYNYGVYRVVSSTNDGFTASIGLLPATTVGDHDDVWAGETVGDHDDFWAGRLVQDIRVRPMWNNVEEPEMLQVFAKTDTDTQPYWDEDPPAEGSVLKDDDTVPFYDEPAGQQGDMPLFLDVDNRPYVEDE